MLTFSMDADALGEVGREGELKLNKSEITISVWKSNTLKRRFYSSVNFNWVFFSAFHKHSTCFHVPSHDVTFFFFPSDSFGSVFRRGNTRDFWGLLTLQKTQLSL